MKSRTTDQLLTLGMALTNDRRTMERRVRGVFARKKSAKGVLILSIMLALALGFAAFTTACQPGKAAVVLTPILVEQTTSDESDQNEVPIDTPVVSELVNAEDLWNPAKELINSASELTGAIPVSVSHISQPPETLPVGIKVLVDADVVVPQTGSYNIRECNLTSFSLDEYRKMIDYFIPDAKWVPNQTTPGFQTNGAYTLEDMDSENGTTLTVEQNGEMFSVSLGGKYSYFSFGRAGEGILQEVYLIGDEEWEQETGDIIRAPIAITQEEAIAQADEVISALSIQGWQIESVQRAVAVETYNNGNVISHGWAFVYGLTSDGLTMYADGNYSFDKNDRLSYWIPDAGALTIYVDERGVTYFNWEKRYTPNSVTYPVASIISAEEALKLAKERIARLYGELAYENTQIEIFDIRLSTMLIGYSDQLTGQPFPDPYEDIALLIPTWNIAFRIIFPRGDLEYYMMPFSATDGGAISMLDF